MSTKKRDEKNLFDTWVLPNGKPIGEATVEDLKAAAQHHKQEAKKAEATAADLRKRAEGQAR